MVLDTNLLNTQHYKVRIKGQMEKSAGKELRSHLHLGVVAIEKRAFRSPSTKVANFFFFFYFINWNAIKTKTCKKKLLTSALNKLNEY